MSTERRIHNPLPGEVVYSRDGRTLGGLESVTTTAAAADDPVTDRLLSTGRLIDTTPAQPKKPSSARRRKRKQDTGIEAASEPTQIPTPDTATPTEEEAPTAVPTADAGEDNRTPDETARDHNTAEEN